MPHIHSRRAFIRDLGISAAAVPFLLNLPSLCFANQTARKQRLVILFSPNGVVPNTFWPEHVGDKFTFNESMKPLEPFRDRSLVLNGICDRIEGDGDNHMRGIGCLLTGIELFPGNVMGGGGTPAGWSTGRSIDQEIKHHLQKQEATRTRFGSLEFGVLVPDRADTWTRMVYDGPNKPIAPVNDPYQMFGKLYGKLKDQESLRSILDVLNEDFRKVKTMVSREDQRLLDEHTTLVRELEQELRANDKVDVGHAVPELEPGVREDNDNMPKISKMQIELIVSGFVADFARVGTLQYTNSVGQAKFRWLGIEDPHHELSHEGDNKHESLDKLTRINKWFCEQVAYLAKRLAETPEPGGPGSLLDNTTIIWTNELGKGNNHSMDDIPFILVGGGMGYKTGQYLNLPKVPHNRMLMTLGQSFGLELKKFGNPDYCGDGILTQLT
ncbi:MAG: DUF1552 domain-containing protein [Planctomycetota bacterium]|nr:DUF1552 domain-containing protein [Planctomycetota bacterium]